MKRIFSIVALSLLLASCAPPAAPIDLKPETKEPGVLVPAGIDAPRVESPALVKIYFLNERDGWGVTETQIVRTNDGGVTWYDMTPPGILQAGFSVSVEVLNTKFVWVQVPDMNNYPNGGTLYHTADAGATWTSFTTPFSAAQMQFLDSNTGNDGWALADLGAGAGSQGVAVYQTIDGGATWMQTYTNDPGSPNAGDSLPLGGIKSGLTPLNMQTAWVSGVTYSDGTVYLYRTDDGGANWSQVTTLALPPDAKKTQVGFEPVKIVTAQDAFVTVHVPSDQSRLAVFVSKDAGNTWSFTPTLIPNGGSADFLSATEAVVYNGEQFYVTRDGARTWSIIPPDILFGESFEGMDFVNLSTGWVVTMDPATIHRSLYRTRDGGATWIPAIP